MAETHHDGQKHSDFGQGRAFQGSIAIGADHAGLSFKEEIVAFIEQLEYRALDLGTKETVPVDYPDIARKVCASLIEGQCSRGIIICGSGVGACVAANKIKGIRAGLCHDSYSAHQGVEHDDMNILCLGARVVGLELAKELVTAFIRASFSGEERHVRRLDKVWQLEVTGKCE